MSLPFQATECFLTDITPPISELKSISLQAHCDMLFFFCFILNVSQSYFIK